ncbi:hypothetical protein BL250_14425 [Erwinia sp. OLTSP20]|uniref:hypothetical protein n=1 Tax=unclassified Erwinia TaxID=2622719 RepID=UPI000C188723|nr:MULTISPECIES: hypothetical protein [unclassified Erwinia]PIJ48243.1 hypothetical protein BV501_17815 [Erwinia sp. OAMSP11]PIJ68743.1 hypothetical protein BK416_16105 [Erwinia sp. OLSSP12]PIJ78918.1 hypothetical protein BLD47_16020 [Erwinia sp. OLCASP19]PIJ79528.1 hypothetical protein BLD46_16815 [Erwinia sp. OLMTSP26]PIJ81486.1 hypothetical protein BLD49_16425 [Erwinia sp. OLMDSP33]
MNESLLSRLSDNHPLSEKDDYDWIPAPNDELLSELKMVLMSHARQPDIAHRPLINTSILNYGLDASFSELKVTAAGSDILETRLKKIITRFEPRLSQISLISSQESAQIICFVLRGIYAATSVQLEIKWNECTGRFIFNE